MEIHCWVVTESYVGVMHAQRQAALNLEVLINRLQKRIRMIIIHETVVPDSSLIFSSLSFLLLREEFSWPSVELPG